MQNEPSNQHESLWRRNTTEASGQQPNAPAEVELELRLTEAMGRLKDVPVPSNFTTRLLAEIDREEQSTVRRSQWSWRGSFWPRLVGTTAALLLTAMVVEHQATVSHRHQLAQTLASVADVHSVPSVDALNNFDAIQAMGQSGHADTELLALAQ